jgi:hypothetical protein
MLTERIKGTSLDYVFPMAELAGTGYDVLGDIERFEKDRSVQSITENMKAYWAEYLVRFPVLPIPIQFDYVGGRKRVIAPRYGNRLLIDTVSANERNGAVLDSTKRICDFLENQAKPGSMALFTSPVGYSGFMTRDGSPVIYRDSQTYVYMVNQGGQIDAITLVTDMSLDQNERFLEEMGGVYVEGAEKVVRSPLFFKEGFDFYDVLQKIAEVKGGEFARGDKTFSDMRDLIARRGELLSLDSATNYKIYEFEAWVVQNIHDTDSQSMDLLKRKIAKTVLEISHNMMVQGREEYGESRSIDYNGAFLYMQSLGGCNGGGIMEMPYGPREYESSDTEVKYLCCKCPFCKKKVIAEIYDGRIHCPKKPKGCGAWAVWR